MVGVMVFNMSLNFLFILKMGLKGIWLIFVKYFKLCIHKCKKVCGPKYENLKEVTKDRVSKLSDKLKKA